MTNHPKPPGPREFWLRQYSQDGGMYSDIRVMKPSDCDLGVSPPPGHDNLKYYEEVHVIEYAEVERIEAELREEKNQFKMAENQLTETVAELREAKAEVERLKAQDLTHAVIAADVKLREERNALAAKLEVAKGALAVYAMTNETFPEYGDVARQALAEIGED